MLPNLIFLFNLLDVIPPDVQRYGDAAVARKLSYVCDTFETAHSRHMWLMPYSLLFPPFNHPAVFCRSAN